MSPSIAKYFILAGFILLLIGTIFYFFGDKLSWLGKLPGDIKWEKGNAKIYFPIVTMLLLSLVLNLIIYIIRKLFS